MPYRALSDASANEALRTVSSGIALCAIALSALGAVLLSIDVATRPPCAPGVTRALDLAPGGPFIALGLAAVAGVAFWRSRRGTALMLWFTVGIVVLACAAFLALGAVATLVHHHGARYDTGCWTF
jgi:hypothetical protein